MRPCVIAGIALNYCMFADLTKDSPNQNVLQDLSPINFKTEFAVSTVKAC